jgi:hypothetical protein
MGRKKSPFSWNFMEISLDFYGLASLTLGGGVLFETTRCSLGPSVFSVFSVFQIERRTQGHTCTHIFWIHLHKGLKGRFSI